MRLTMLMLALCAVLAAGCCSADPAPAAGAQAGLELEPVIAQPIRGICTPRIFGCKLCIGFDCETPELVTPAVFGTPAQRVAPAAAYDPCTEVYAAPDPCGSASEPYCPECDVPAWGSASDAGFDYGTPPDLAR